MSFLKNLFEDYLGFVYEIYFVSEPLHFTLLAIRFDPKRCHAACVAVLACHHRVGIHNDQAIEMEVARVSPPLGDQLRRLS